MTILTLTHESPFQLESRDDILYDDAYWTWIGTFNEMMLVGRGWKGVFPIWDWMGDVKVMQG